VPEGVCSKLAMLGSSRLTIVNDCLKRVGRGQRILHLFYLAYVDKMIPCPGKEKNIALDTLSNSSIF